MRNNLKDAEPVDLNKKLPLYGFLYFFQNMKGYRLAFFLLTAIAVLSTFASFYSTYLLSEILNVIKTLTVDDVLYYYAPLYLSLVVFDQVCGWFTRRYGEALPTLYTNHQYLRFFNSFLHYKSSKFFNYSKEKIVSYTDKYLGNVSAFLSDWNWQMPRHITRLGLTIWILYEQSPIVLGVNIAYIALFMVLSIHLAKKISKPIRAYSEQNVETNSIKQNLFQNLNSVKRLFNNEYFINFYKKYLLLTNNKFEDVRKVHAFRWILQLNLFNLIYISTFFYGVIQIINGQLDLGFLLLIQYAFNNLFAMLIYFIEYFTTQIHQRHDAELFNIEIDKLKLERSTSELKDVDKLSLQNIKVTFSDDKGKQTEIKIPHLDVYRGDKIAILGESGSGKSTVLSVLTNQTDFEGTYKIRLYPLFQTVYAKQHSLKNFTVINSSDALFNMSIKDNITLGHYESERFNSITKGLTLDKFIDDYDKCIGDKDVNLSAGQMQRIRLARGLYQNTEYVLLDEPFNGIDDENKNRIITFLIDHLKNKMVILVTHNASEIAVCGDGVVVYSFNNQRELVKAHVL